MSSGDFLFSENPRRASSNCMEEAPASNRTPSAIPCDAMLDLSNIAKKSVNVPWKNRRQSLKQDNAHVNDKIR